MVSIVMSILKHPYKNSDAVEIECALCGRLITSDCATFGPVNAEGIITILCAGHLWDGLKFIDQLADYMAEERKKYFRNNGNDIMRFGGGGQDARFIY